MSERFEQNIREWYTTSKAVNLEYLDLAKVANPKSSDIANNIGVIYNKVNLLSKVSLKHFYSLREESLNLKQEVSLLRKTVVNLECEIVRQKALTKLEVREIIREVIQKPKLVEEEALRLTEELRKGVNKVEHLIADLKGLIGK